MGHGSALIRPAAQGAALPLAVHKLFSATLHFRCGNNAFVSDPRHCSHARRARRAGPRCRQRLPPAAAAEREPASARSAGSGRARRSGIALSAGALAHCPRTCPCADGDPADHHPTAPGNVAAGHGDTSACPGTARYRDTSDAPASKRSSNRHYSIAGTGRRRSRAEPASDVQPFCAIRAHGRNRGRCWRHMVAVAARRAGLGCPGCGGGGMAPQPGWPCGKGARNRAPPRRPGAGSCC